MKAHTFSLVFFLFSVAQGLNPKCEIQDQGSNLQVPSKPLSWEEDVLQTQAKDQARLQYLSSLVAKKPVVPIASGKQIVQSCLGCSSTVFDNAKSTTFQSLGCQAPQSKQIQNPSCDGSDNTCIFNMTYGGTFTLANDSVSSYTFGCLQKTTGNSVPPQGLLGLGRGPLSLLSQTQDLYQSTFSYCLPNVSSANFSGSLRLGPVGQPVRIKYSPLLKNPRRPSVYFVNLIGIRVGNKVVDIPPSAIAFNPNTGAGTIIDSGTIFTRLVEPAYVAVRDEFQKLVKVANIASFGGFDTCYTVSIVASTITYMFASMNVTFPQDNLLIHSTIGSITCLAMATAPNNVNYVLNVRANMQQ
ncbi:hypothetical protein ES288_A05G308300v1 [Gossypium darwinii]|uniref:Peptidase A1 domain-containing protein n=1 Tax=Gossypium darwinii TaxID=34276 RepID=A0A5D2GM27_GOSDA|nr:hypothetical protein ES288_A05G308300v1 [Gossypium darwinii]